MSVRALGTMLEISVEDQNERIPKEEYTSIFKRFCRGSNSEGIEGGGIGLYITSEILEQQGGYAAIRQGKEGNLFALVMPK